MAAISDKIFGEGGKKKKKSFAVAIRRLVVREIGYTSVIYIDVEETVENVQPRFVAK